MQTDCSICSRCRRSLRSSVSRGHRDLGPFSVGESDNNDEDFRAALCSVVLPCSGLMAINELLLRVMNCSSVLTRLFVDCQKRNVHFYLSIPFHQRRSV